MERNKESMYLDLLGPEYNEAFMLGILKVLPAERKVFFDYHFVEITGIKGLKPNCWVDLDSSGLIAFLQDDMDLYLYIRSIFRGDSKKDIDSINITTSDNRSVQVKVVVNDRYENGMPKEIIAVFIDVSVLEKRASELSKLNALFETSQQVSRASTWWHNYDEGAEFFYQTDNGAINAGLVPSKDKRYSVAEYGKMRERAAELNEDYKKAIDEEIVSFRRAWNGEIDTFGARTPLMTPQNEIVWVESRGKVVLRYEDGTPRFIIAVDIFINDIIKKEEELFKLQSIIDQGLHNSSIGVWWHDYEDGHYYFHQTESYKAVMGIENLTDVDQDSKVWANYITKFKKDYPQYIKYLDADAELFQKAIDGEINQYENIVPVLSNGKDIKWIEVRATCIRRNEDGKSILMVGVNVDVTERLKTEEKILELEKRNYVLNNANKVAIDTAKLLVWSDDQVDSAENDLFYANDLYIETLGLPTYKNGYVSNEDIEKSLILDEDYAESWKLLKYKRQEMIRGNIDSFEHIELKHKNLVSGKIVYLEHNGSIQFRNADGTASSIGGFIRDITDSVMDHLEIEKLNVLNARLEKANSLAIKSGQVLVWYQNLREFDILKYFFGNDTFAEKLGLTPIEGGLFSVEEYRKTVYADSKETQELVNEFLIKSKQMRNREITKYERVLVPHQNLKTKEVFYFEHYSDIDLYTEDESEFSAGGFLIDVTELVKNQKQIEYLANRDSLTGLYNRNFFDTYVNEKLPNDYSILMFDLDGLKLINDTYGHIEGDKVLKFTADLLVDVFGTEAIISRIGGDEFTVISKLLNENEFKNKLGKIRKAIDKSNEGATFKIDLSYGCNSVISGEPTFKVAFSNAENIMYRRKLTERRERKAASLEMLVETLYLKTDETKSHVKSLVEYCVITLKELGFSRDSEIKNMEKIARIHDIGKLTIDEGILLKKSSLTFEEYEEVKKHSESGYKIVRNIIDSDTVADAVLFHHERWDGTGYPMRLKGTEIPLEARILSVCDAYEVMTSGRVYQKPISREEAFKELKDCAGSQFDKDVVNAFLKALEKGDE